MPGMGMIVAGMAEGWSEGRLGEIKAERDAKIQALADARADKRTQQDQQFRSQEAAIGADRQVAENKRQEGVAAVEKQKDRDLTILKGAEKPADQQMVEYLQTTGLSQKDALDWVKTSRGKSEEDSKLALYTKILTANGGDSEAAQAETDKVWEKYGKKADSGGVSSDALHIEGATPPGEGTEKAPYRADTPNHVAWFKKYAKPGTFIVDPNTGDIYKK